MQNRINHKWLLIYTLNVQGTPLSSLYLTRFPYTFSETLRPRNIIVILIFHYWVFMKVFSLWVVPCKLCKKRFIHSMQTTPNLIYNSTHHYMIGKLASFARMHDRCEQKPTLTIPPTRKTRRTHQFPVPQPHLPILITFPPSCNRTSWSPTTSLFSLEMNQTELRHWVITLPRALHSDWALRQIDSLRLRRARKCPKRGFELAVGKVSLSI